MSCLECGLELFGNALAEWLFTLIWDLLTWLARRLAKAARSDARDPELKVATAWNIVFWIMFPFAVVFSVGLAISLVIQWFAR